MDARSRRPWTILLAGLCATIGGCIIVEDDHHDDGMVWVDENENNTDAPMTVTIDPDEAIEAAPGDGVGLYVEYASGGSWRIWTTCDTNYSSSTCIFDACVEAIDGGTGIERAHAEALEDYDAVDTYSDGSVCLHAETDNDTDGMTFTTDPGATVRLDVALDGTPNPHYVYWISNTIVHPGAPTNPVDFKPSAP